MSPFDLASRFIGVQEVEGSVANPQILAMLRLDFSHAADDDVPWCSAFVNYVCWLLRLPRSKSLAARSWLGVGREVPLTEARADSDIVVLKRGKEPQPGPDVRYGAPGHVGFFAGYSPATRSVQVLGGNQGNGVSIAHYPVDAILSVRRLG